MQQTATVVRAAGALLLCSIISIGLRAQQTPTATTPEPAPAAAPAPASDTVKLSPFEVQASSDKGYSELNSNSITQFQAELSHMPVSADVFDQKFMEDTDTTSVEELLTTYSAGAGLANANPGSSSSNSQALDRNGNSFVSLRGVTAPTMQRDGLMPLNTFFNSGSTGTGITSTFDVESVNVVKGPQALLYGVGGAGGVINLVSKQARLNQPAFGSAEFKVDQYGHKTGLLDYGMGTDNFAVRVAVTDQQFGNRRVNIGGPMTGQYIQVAARWGNTVFRVNTENTLFNRTNSGNPSVTASSSSNDARNGINIRYLLFTNQIQSAANGAPSGAGPILDGAVNYNNVDSFAGWFDGELTKDWTTTASATTQWAHWLSTQVTAGYRWEFNQTFGGGPSIVAPNVSTNSFGTWEATSSGGGLYEPLREKAVRASAVLVNSIFGGNDNSKTVFGADFTRADGAVITEGYVQADSNFNPTQSGVPTTDNGYTAMPSIAWAVPNGPVYEPYFTPLQPHVTYQGVNYTWVTPNDTVSSLISPSNPLGLSGHGSGDHRIGIAINRGIYGANYTDWLGGKLTTLLGFRYGYTFEVNQLESSAPQPPSTELSAMSHTTSFNAGVNYQLLNWLRPYVTASDSYDPPAVLSADPYGNSPKVANAIGEEAGLKFVAGTNLSGSVAWYHASSKNEQYSFTSTLTNDINPAGLNGRFGAVSNFVNINRETQGFEATLTSNPTPNWRMRLSAAFVKGTIENGLTEPQFYNDQFHENSSGQVTFADGTVVYVAPTLNTKNAAFTQANAPAGSFPLTVALMNTTAPLPGQTATNPYYANPTAITGQINGSSGAGIVIKSVDPVHGAILTGLNGLPISQLQIAPLASAPPPGSIVLSSPGDYTTGYPRYSFNYTAIYTIPTGLLNGLEFGGTALASWQQSNYYFYPNGTGSPNASRILFYQPMLSRFDGILAYKHKFRRVLFHTQLNITNIFNHYHAFLLPNAVTGFAGTYSVTFDQQPRMYTWSSTISF